MKAIFKNEDFLKERTKFYYIECSKFELSRTKLFTDNENYVISQSEPGAQTWMWTIDNISLGKLRELREILYNYYVTNDKITFTSKKEVYNYLFRHNRKFFIERYFEMGTYNCLEPIRPKDVDAYIDNFHESDYSVAARYRFLEQAEINLCEGGTLDAAYKYVKQWIDNENYWVLRNREGKIVSMLGYRLFDNLAKISNVYTPEEERRKGYCSYLIYNITKKLLEDGYIPLLYTDYNYKNSNMAYKNVGYKDTGLLVNYTLRK